MELRELRVATGECELRVGLLLLEEGGLLLRPPLDGLRRLLHLRGGDTAVAVNVHGLVVPAELCHVLHADVAIAVDVRRLEHAVHGGLVGAQRLVGRAGRARRRMLVLRGLRQDRRAWGLVRLGLGRLRSRRRRRGRHRPPRDAVLAAPVQRGLRFHDEGVLALEVGQLGGDARRRALVGAVGRHARLEDFIGVDLLELALLVGVEGQRELVLDAWLGGERDDDVAARLRRERAKLEVDAVAKLGRCREEHLRRLRAQQAVPALAAADDEAHRRVVGLRLQALDVAHVGLDVARLEEEEDARLHGEREHELAVARPRRAADRPPSGGFVALVLEIILDEAVALAAVVEGVEESGALPVVLGLDVREEEVGLPVVVAVVGEQLQSEAPLPPWLEHEGEEDVRGRRRLLERVLSDHLRERAGDAVRR